MMAISPFDGKKYYFVDKCLPFGAAISCAIFQAFSDALSHIVAHRTLSNNLNYLDDFFFVERLLSSCNWVVDQFIQVCDLIGFPISPEKTVWGTRCLSFLGFLLDTWKQLVFIPIEKVDNALMLIEAMLNRPSSKTTLLEVQKLCGVLNFISRCVVPGKAFTRRLYALTKGLTKPHQHVKLKQENKLDLKTWQTFLRHPAVFSRPFADFDKTWLAQEINLFTDSSLNANLGCGGISERSWFVQQWDPDFIKDYTPSIAYLELYAVTAAVLLWIHRYENKKIALFCDNLSVVHMINKNTSGCKNCMVLIRLIVLHGLLHNVKITAKHISTKDNFLADHLSRLRVGTFKKLTNNNFEKTRCEIPQILWPMSKIWLK